MDKKKLLFIFGEKQIDSDENIILIAINYYFKERDRIDEVYKDEASRQKKEIEVLEERSLKNLDYYLYKIKRLLSGNYEIENVLDYTEISCDQLTYLHIVSDFMIDVIKNKKIKDFYYEFKMLSSKILYHLETYNFKSKNRIEASKMINQLQERYSDEEYINKNKDVIGVSGNEQKRY